ncbi:MAG: adenylate/guanylate cyclase domain-containing protein [Pseudomonadota bacterium]
MPNHSDKVHFSPQADPQTGSGTRTELQFDGPLFERWMVLKSFALLKPICTMGFCLVLLALLGLDSMLIRQRAWEKDIQFLMMIVWHTSVATFFLLFMLAHYFKLTRKRERLALVLFLVFIQLLSTWFGFITWALAGDLSMFAISMLVCAAIFDFPGILRRILYVGTALTLALAMFFSGRHPQFFTQGEFVSLLSIVAVSFLVDGFMMKQSRTLYRRQRMEEIERERADHILYNALPASIADELKQNNVVKAERFDKMTVLFADIVGFTHYSSTVTPDALVFVLNQIFSEFDSLVDTYAVEKIKTIGDAYMVVGKGNTVAMADLGLDFLRAIERYNRTHELNFALRIGIHVGPTVAGVIGLKRFLYDVWGDAVNFASRLESTSLPGMIHVSGDFRDTLGAAFSCRARGMVEIRGKGPVETWFLLERIVPAQRFAHGGA